jgi:hippurate hydrolase
VPLKRHEPYQKTLSVSGAKMIKTCLTIGLLFLSGVSVAAQQSLDAMVDKDIASLLETYKTLHMAPELSHREEKTSAFLASRLRSLGYTVTERIGKYEHPEWAGYGVVAVLKNGAGPTVLVRSDMDALPVEEKTGLAYASSVKTKNDAGVEVGVMHACGHDIHMTSLLGTAKMLVQLKDQWSGTLILLGQPAEETGDGARALLNDGLYGKVPQPDYAIALHDSPDYPAGIVAFTPGYALSSSTSVDIKIRGVGGHGSRPDAAKDPIVLAAQVILALQTIVSRENSPFDPAVVTVGSIHGGTRYNIIPDEVNLQLTIRITNGVAAAAGIPADRAPIIKINETEVTTATYNDPALTERLSKAVKTVLGPGRVSPGDPIMASEDFGKLGLDRKIPTTMFWLGAADAEKLKTAKATGVALPSLHSAFFAPVPEPTLRAGITAMTAAVLELMKKK